MVEDMKRSTNGDGKQRVVITCTEVAKQGWAYFAPDKEPTRKADLPMWLNRALNDWQQQHPNKRVRSSLGIVADGMTVAIHIWFDEIKE